MEIPYLTDSTIVRDKRVIIRLDLNVPVTNGLVTDPYRINQIITTLDFLHLNGAKSIILAHCEDGAGTTLAPMCKYLIGFLEVKFCSTFFTPEANKMVNDLEDGEIILFENIRINPGEKANDEEFSKKLAAYGDIYVDEAFSVAHRSHASIVGLPSLLPHFAGFHFKKEVESISKVFNPPHPFLFILGGAKFDTKLPLIKKYLDKADSVFVGGALANDVLKNMGVEVGKSLLSTVAKPQTMSGVARPTEGGFRDEFGIKEMLASGKLLEPIDVTVKTEASEIVVKKLGDILPTDYIGDCGPETLNMLKQKISEAKFVVWNGPLGNFEGGFTEQTETLAKALAESSAEVIVGGGDTLASIESLDLMDKFTFVSSAGGAMLDFLVNETLPGIEALLK